MLQKMLVIFVFIIVGEVENLKHNVKHNLKVKYFKPI